MEGKHSLISISEKQTNKKQGLCFGHDRIIIPTTYSLLGLGSVTFVTYKSTKYCDTELADRKETETERRRTGDRPLNHVSAFVTD